MKQSLFRPAFYKVAELSAGGRWACRNEKW